MDITLTLNEAIWLLVALLLACLIVFLIVLIARLNKSVKKIDKVVDDVEVITSSAKDKVVAVDSTISDIIETLDNFFESFKGKKGFFNAFGNIASCATSLVALIKNKDKKEDK